MPSDAFWINWVLIPLSVLEVIVVALVIAGAVSSLSKANGERPFIVAMIQIGACAGIAAFFHLQSAITRDGLPDDGWGLAAMFGLRLVVIYIALIIARTPCAILKRERRIAS